ncbi:MAG: phosphatidate cytidylyltransferase, partial [Deltaproteobacteria bacterium]|nr:phosphatidate cytidylyltransferase [Deltaproteobacteria bacterium]
KGEGTLKRVVTGLILIPAVIYIVLYTTAFWVFAAVSVLTLLSFLEFNNLSILKARHSRTDMLGVLAGVSMPFFLYFCGKEAVLPVIAGALFIFFLNGLFDGRDLKDRATDIACKTMGVVYIALPFSYLIPLRRLEGGQWWILFLLALVWSNDTFAYITGKAVGSHKLTSISPKKTVEGAVGGVIGGGVAAGLFNFFFDMGLSYAAVAVLSVVVGLIALVGDLAESLLKRAAGVKDSGSILPGHGGILDRVDSLLFPIPLLYYILIWRLQCPI